MLQRVLEEMAAFYRKERSTIDVSSDAGIVVNRMSQVLTQRMRVRTANLSFNRCVTAGSSVGQTSCAEVMQRESTVISSLCSSRHEAASRRKTPTNLQNSPIGGIPFSIFYLCYVRSHFHDSGQTVLVFVQGIILSRCEQLSS